MTMPAVMPRRLTALRPSTIDLLEAQLPEKWRGRVRDHFMLTYEFVPLAATATDQREIAIQSDADYILVAATCVVTSTDNLTLLAFVPQMVALFNSGSGRNFQTAATHFRNVFGTGDELRVFPQPKLMPASGTLVVQHQNLEATARNIRGAFYGFKLFRSMKAAGIEE